MDLSDLLRAPYLYLGLIWGFNFLFLYYLIKKNVLKNTQSEWKPHLHNTEHVAMVGLMTHKYLASLKKSSEEKDTNEFVLFVHHEIIYNLSQFLDMKMKDLVSKMRDEQFVRGLFDDREVILFLISPLQWLEQYTQVQTFLFFFKRRTYSPLLKERLVEMILRIKNQTLFRS